MAKKFRLIITSLYIKHDQFNELGVVNFNALQESLKQYISRRGNGKDCVSIVRAFPVMASSNTADVELTAFNENINFINETDASDGITDIIDDYIDLEFSRIVIKQTNGPIEIRGVFD